MRWLLHVGPGTCDPAERKEGKKAASKDLGAEEVVWAVREDGWWRWGEVVGLLEVWEGVCG